MNYSVNWFKYRLPGSAEIVSGASSVLLDGMAEGFIIAPFFQPIQGMKTIPLDFIPSAEDIKPSDGKIPSSTPAEDYFAEINAIIDGLRGSKGKTVAARVINIKGSVDPVSTFSSLCNALPDAFVFMFSAKTYGTWIGASPELLLRKEENYISTMALAGTREATDIDAPWDVKNVEEQEMVADFIRNCLEKISFQTITGKTFTKNAGKIEHICTPISAFLYAYSDERIIELISLLSPTPALCGSDRDTSLEIIEKYEHFNREMYGGFCGPNGIMGNTAFYVILRAAKFNCCEAAVYVGGGITNLSVEKDEWIETELKSKTIINQLIFSEK